jgi:hypothetical protein
MVAFTNETSTLLRAEGALVVLNDAIYAPTAPTKHEPLD